MFGLLLLSAAGLKIYDNSLEPLGRRTLLAPGWVQVAVILAEALPGSCLVLGLLACALPSATIEFFSALGGPNPYFGVIGQQSCRGFDRFTVSSWSIFSRHTIGALVRTRSHPSFADISGLWLQSA